MYCEFIAYASSVFLDIFQVPVLLLPLKCLPILCGVVAAAVTLVNNFKIILIERGAGRNGSTVAVSC